MGADVDGERGEQSARSLDGRHPAPRAGPGSSDGSTRWRTRPRRPAAGSRRRGGRSSWPGRRAPGTWPRGGLARARRGRGTAPRGAGPGTPSPSAPIGHAARTPAGSERRSAALPWGRPPRPPGALELGAGPAPGVGGHAAAPTGRAPARERVGVMPRPRGADPRDARRDAAASAPSRCRSHASRAAHRQMTGPCRSRKQYTGSPPAWRTTSTTSV